MGRAASKTDLSASAKEQFRKLQDLTDSMSADEQNAVFTFEVSEKDKEAHWKRDRNLRDIFIHLYEWHQLVLNWVEANMNGEMKPFLPHPYNWKTYGVMNEEFREKHQSTSYDLSREMLQQSHDEVMSLIEDFSDEQLFEKKYFPWTGASALGSYFVSAAPSHYDWAMKKIRRHIKSYRETHEN